MHPDEQLETLSDEDRQGLTWRLDVLERRREESDRFAWAVPGLVIAAQAFLLSVALNANTHPFGRLLAAGAGLVTLLATAHLMAKQVHHFDVFEAVIERDRERLGLPGVQMDALTLDPQPPFPENTSYMKRGWWKGWRRVLVVDRKAVAVWAITLGLLAVLDLGLVVYSAFAWAGRDPGWLS
jgi:hypothetical protein